MVQEEFRRRKSAGKRTSSINCFASRIVCTECGGLFGRKVWHSGSKYEQRVWHCNNKFTKRTFCSTPHLKEEAIKKAFVGAFNELLTHREELIESYRDKIEKIMDFSKLKKEQEKIIARYDLVESKIKKLISENAKATIDCDEYDRKYDRLAKEYRELKERNNEIKLETTRGKARGDVTIDTSRLLGYTKDKSGEIIIDKEQAEIVKIIFEMYLDGIGSCTIAEILNKKNIKTYTKFKWGSNRILSILSNEKYKGECLTQKTFVNSNEKEVLNKGEMTKWYIENHHIPIIDREEWDRAEKLRLSKRLKVYEFTSLIICPFCGANLTRYSQEQKYISWICGTYLRKGKDECIGMRIREQDLKELAEKYKIDKPMVLIKEKKRNGKESSSFISPKEYFKK